MIAIPHAHRQIHLAPGQLLVLRQGGVVSTVLGSCVAVTMFHAESRLAAICHAMLAEPNPLEPRAADDERRFRFMAIALPTMIDLYRRASVLPPAIQVKVFGGANVIQYSDATDSLAIGSSNVAITRRILADAGLTIAAENTGGHRGRKIIFDADTGEVLHKHLRKPAP